MVIWDAATDIEIVEFPESRGTPFFSPDGSKLACIGEKLTIRSVDPPESKPVPP